MVALATQLGSCRALSLIVLVSLLFLDFLVLSKARKLSVVVCPLQLLVIFAVSLCQFY